MTCADEELYGDELHVEEPTEQFVSFRLGDEWYAVAIVCVREIVRASQIAFLPSAPAHIVGVTNLRGNIISVTDPKRLFGLGAAPASRQQRIVVVESATAETGLLVDEMGEIVTVATSLLEPPLATFDAAESGFMEHTCRWGERLLAVLKTEKLLTAAGQTLLAEE
jgi:purine-binding chemotaxis protein CheW